MLSNSRFILLSESSSNKSDKPLFAIEAGIINGWEKYIDNENVKTYVLKESKELVGYFEKIYHQDRKETEIAYLGILEEYFGKNYGSYLLSEAIKISFENNCKRVWVHTCSLDHKNALKNYQKRGMKIFKSEKINFNL